MNNDTNIIKVAVVDDHRLVTQMIIEKLQTYKEICSWGITFTSGIQLLHHMREAEDLPDIVLMDYSMPGMMGPVATEWLLAKYPKVKVVALSGWHYDAPVKEMKDAGCCGFLPKTITTEDLREALSAIYHTGKCDNLEFLKKGALKAEIATNRMSCPLKADELIYLDLYSKGKSEKEIAFLMCKAKKTLEGYKNRIFEKLEVNSRAEMIVKAIAMGLINPAK
jgi:DNA-binding NarL/FixJ family response regulator